MHAPFVGLGSNSRAPRPSGISTRPADRRSVARVADAVEDVAKQKGERSVLHLVPFGGSERVRRLSSLSFRHDIGPQTPVRVDLRSRRTSKGGRLKPNFIAARVLNGFVLSKVYVHSSHLVAGKEAVRGRPTKRPGTSRDTQAANPRRVFFPGELGLLPEALNLCVALRFRCLPDCAANSFLAECRLRRRDPSTSSTSGGGLGFLYLCK